MLCHRYAPLSEAVLAEPILFGDFATILDSTDADAAPPRLYRDVGSYSTLQPLFESLLAAYNAKHKPMQLVFFDDALEHLTRIIRTLSLPMVSCRRLSV
jgi:dynein heavy chain